MLARSSTVVWALLSLPATWCAGADKTPPTPKGLERSLVVTSQGYFPVTIRLKDGRIAAVLRGGAGHLGIKDHPVWRVHCGALIYTPPPE